MKAVAKCLASDDPAPDIFKERVDELLSILPADCPQIGISESIEYFRTRSGFDDRLEIGNLILKWLDWETGGRCEQIFELRITVISTENVLRRGVISLEAKVKEWGAENKIKYPEASFFLRDYLGPKTTERDIREAIQQRIIAHLHWKKEG